MSVKTILTEPNKLLRQVSEPVESVGDSEKQLMDDMLDTMYAANGIGLAAIQIGVPKRIIVMDISLYFDPIHIDNFKYLNRSSRKSFGDVIMCFVANKDL